MIARGRGWSSGRADALVLLGLLALAALLRLPSLATRGTWDADQGHDMLVLRTFVQDGVVPLLGPPTSIGDVGPGFAVRLPGRSSASGGSGASSSPRSRARTRSTFTAS